MSNTAPGEPKTLRKKFVNVYRVFKVMQFKKCIFIFKVNILSIECIPFKIIHLKSCILVYFIVIAIVVGFFCFFVVFFNIENVAN